MERFAFARYHFTNSKFSCTISAATYYCWKMMLFSLFFLFAATDVSSLENFLNRCQDFAYKINVSIKGKKPKLFHGLFYWNKGAHKTACALVYDEQVGHRSLMIREGKKTYHYVVYADPRNKTTK